MTFTEALTTVRYVMDANGDKTDVLIPLTTWETLLASWQRVVEMLEDQEDKAILQAWLEKRAAGEVEMIPLETLEQELISVLAIRKRPPYQYTSPWSPCINLDARDSGWECL